MSDEENLESDYDANVQGGRTTITDGDIDIQIEIQEKVMGVRTHIVEGWIKRIPEGFIVSGVPLPDGTEGHIPVNNIIEQYENEEVRIVVVSLADAQRLATMAQEMAPDGTTGN